MIRLRLRGFASATLLVLLASAGPALAQNGFNLSWSDCGAFGIASRTFACTSNAGSNSLVASAISGADLTQLVGMQSIIYLQTNQPSLSNWWQLGPGGCRWANPPILSASFDFATQFNCMDPWAGAAGGGLVYAPGYGAPYRARILVTCAVPQPVSINSTDEYYLYRLTLTNERSTGAGSCAGCGDGACIMLNDVVLKQPAGVGDVHITTPIVRDYASWQPFLGSECPFYIAPPVSTRGSTWGAVKSMYR